MVAFFLPSEINAVQREKTEWVLNSVMMDLLANTWDGKTAVFTVSDVRSKVVATGFNPFVFPWWEEVFQGLLNEYVEGGWDIERAFDYLHFFIKGQS